MPKMEMYKTTFLVVSRRSLDNEGRVLNIESDS